MKRIISILTGAFLLISTLHVFASYTSTQVNFAILNNTDSSCTVIKNTAKPRHITFESGNKLHPNDYHYLAVDKGAFWTLPLRLVFECNDDKVHLTTMVHFKHPWEMFKQSDITVSTDLEDGKTVSIDSLEQIPPYFDAQPGIKLSYVLTTTSSSSQRLDI